LTRASELARGETLVDGGAMSPNKPPQPATTVEEAPRPPTPTTAAPATFASVAELAKAIADDPQHLDGRAIEVTAQYLNAKLQNVAGAIHYDVTLVDGKDSAATGVTCRTKTKVMVASFKGVTARGTVHGATLEDCTVAPR
jgi:hypothetical protein